MKSKIHPAWFVTLGLLATVVVLTAISDSTSPASPTHSLPAKAAPAAAPTAPEVRKNDPETQLTMAQIEAGQLQERRQFL